jgi:multiple sugar transport system ATP-binding protein
MTYACNSSVEKTLWSTQPRLGVSTVYITHDQVETMTMGHRIAIFNQGKSLRIATPAKLYRTLANKFVGTLIGSPKMNVGPAELLLKEPVVALQSIGTTLRNPHTATRNDLVQSGAAEIRIRSGNLHWAEDAPSRCTERARGAIEGVETTSAESFVLKKIGLVGVNAKVPSYAAISIGQQVTLVFDPDDLLFFDAVSGDSLRIAPSVAEVAMNAKTH